MLQFLQREKEAFFVQHGHLGQDDLRRCWRQRMHQLDDQIPVDHPHDMALSDSDALDIPTPFSDAGYAMGRRLSVPMAPGIPVPFRQALDLSKSAPSDLVFMRTQQRQPDSTNAIQGPIHGEYSMADDNSSLWPLDSRLYAGQPSSSPNNFGPVVPHGYDAPHTFDAAIDHAQAGPEHYGPTSTLSWSPSYLAVTGSKVGQSSTAIHQHANLQGLPLNIRPTGSPTTGELMTSSPLADVTFANGMSRQNYAISSTSMRGDVDLMNFDSSYPSVSRFPHIDSCGDFSYSSSCVSSNVSAFFPTQSDSSRLVSTPFDFLGEDASSLSNLSPSVVDCPQVGPGFVVEDWSGPLEDIENLNTDHESPAYQQRFDATAVTRSRRIAPKTDNESAVSFPAFEPPTKPDTLRTADGKRKFAIPKAPYARPKYPKRMCDQCNEHPDGFRGEHELKRHIDRAHTSLPKMWVCVDNSPDGKYLANCKKCRSGKKYGAYYNAAAHLRRAHFNKRPRGRGRGKSGEKRGGIGGGDQPPMQYLKDWMKEVEHVPYANGSESPPSDDDFQTGDSPSPTTSPLSFEPFEFECPDMMSEGMSCRLASSPPQHMSSYARRPSRHQQPSQSGTKDCMWPSRSSQRRPGPSRSKPNTMAARRDVSPNANANDNVAHRSSPSSFGSCCFEASDTQSRQISSAAFEADFFPMQH